MPTKETTKKAKRKLRQGKSPSTAAGEFVREEIEHVRKGKHGARSTKQAIAIGLSKARRAGIPLKPPKKGKAKTKKGRQARLRSGTGQAQTEIPSARRSRAISKALKREPHKAASRKALARQATRAAARRSATERSAAARKAAATKGPAARQAAARKAARTRAMA